MRFIIADIAYTPDCTNTHNSDRALKSSKYIPKRLLKCIQEMEGKKVALRDILQFLEVRR
ncbi:MAG: hypothetical protein HWQ35_21625 [Nostoc sp. NMS1]|uniref:hypothetical protein n=1 Tax=unclassified Nostoc TaxID=2593658 RepID=UPI0025ED5BA1|nr:MULTISPECIES: hypothetical protein [unclassified Nostoc]MBN3909057.1 hypothetical protein [Nostoc sp. NMS1]MBN3992391.1 hypothetical protein [Nostoc sp. NMS2]